MWLKPMWKNRVWSKNAAGAETPRPQRKILAGWVTPVLLMALSAASAAPGGRTAPVKVASAEIVRMAPQSWVSGTVISRNQARLSAEVTGRLVQVAEVGARIDKGQVVARIDLTFAKLKVEESEAAVERERARLGFFESEVQRLKRLAKQNNAALTQLDQTRADGDAARNELRVSSTRLEQAREELRRHDLRAPFTGIVVERLMRSGERAAVGDAIVQLQDTDNLELQARVPLATLDYVVEGDTLNFKAEDREFTGRVRALVPAGDARSRLLELRLSLPVGRWTAGQPLRLALPTANAKDVLTVPRDALVLRRNGAFVFRVDGENTAQRIAVTLGVASGPLVAVSGDLQAGDRVVVRGGERLRPGSAVKILDGVQ